jgi:2'-5' RNA ligase
MAMTYHLWLKPSGKAYDLLIKTIADLSHVYAGPVFEPHLTLLGSLPGTAQEISSRSSQLGTSLQPFDIHLTEPAHGDHFFQCVFLKVRHTPALMNAHNLACKLFDRDASPFVPHLSLLYGQYSPELLDKIVATLPDTLCLSFTVDRLDLIRAKSENPKDWATILTVSLGH